MIAGIPETQLKSIPGLANNILGEQGDGDFRD